jgi:hypothetical protein
MLASVFTLATLALATISSVTALPNAHASIAITRRGKENWPSNLEDYDIYHKRYIALQCQNKHDDTKYFNTCCTPMLKGQKLSSRPDNCDPAKLNKDDDGDCDDDDKPTSTKKSSTAASTSTKNSKPTPPPSKFDHQGGRATFFFQNGVAGACGKKHPDSYPLVALTKSLYGSFSRTSSNCGRQVLIRNKKNGKTVTATVEDGCPSCGRSNDLDLSTGAFDKIATRAEGEVDIEWTFI